MLNTAKKRFHLAQANVARMRASLNDPVMEGRLRVGCIALRPLAEGICEMKRLYVRTHARICGVGWLLAERVIVEARGAGYLRMNLDALPTMDGALRLYQRLGFRDIPANCYNPLAGARYLALDLK